MNKYKIKFKNDKEINEDIINMIDNKATFNLNDIINTITLDNNNIIIERENEEYYFAIDFIRKKSIYKLKDYNLEFDIPVIIANYSIKDNKIELNYQLESNESLITISLERMI